LLEDHRKIPFLREALVSGLDHHEREFINTQLLGSSDHNIIGWLEEGSRGSNGIGEVLNDLSGDDLASFERGKSMFHGEAACFGCHGADGGGAPNLGPPLDESEWVVGKPEVLVRILLHGMTGPLSVAGTRYAPTADMPGLAANPTMSDQHLADIATYIRHEWCNRAAPISANFIHQERVTHQAREGRAWTAEELMK
jgi:mono/diheme cytochrome c family protein